MGGQRVVVRVQDGDTGTNEVSYLLSDHLGSTARKVAELRYMPFGETRYVDGATPTDYRYTGQLEEGEIGLYFYNARWYDASLGRFVQGDSVVPGAGNVMAYDRYSYVFNNPLRYTDPSGHISCSNSRVAEGDCSDLTTKEILETIYNVVFNDDDGWKDEYISAVYHGVRLVGQAFLRTFDRYETADEAFRAVYENVTFGWGNCPECAGAGGYTYGAHLIRFASLSNISAQRRVNNVIHELGHAFDWVMAGLFGEDSMPRNILEQYWGSNSFPRRSTPYTPTDREFYGLAGPRNQRVWHQNPSGSSGEEFADTFLAWTIGAWQTIPGGGYHPDAQQRMDFINPLMTTWLGYFK